MYCAGGACGDGVAEVIVGASVEFRCALDSSLAVTADVRFAWSEKAAKKLGGDPKDLEADVLRRAALLLLEYDKGRPGGRDDEDGDEKSAPGDGDADGDGDGDGDADADEETREGAALRAVLRESARRVCAARGLGAHKASVTVAGSPPESVWATASADDADDSGGRGFARASLADAGGAVWVSVETTSERETRERLDASSASAGSGDRSRRGANGERARVPPGDRRGPPTLLRRIASVASAVAAEGTAPRAARAYFAASEIAQEMLAWRVLSATRKAPEGGTPGEEEGTPREKKAPGGGRRHPRGEGGIAPPGRGLGRSRRRRRGGRRARPCPRGGRRTRGPRRRTRLRDDRGHRRRHPPSTGLVPRRAARGVHRRRRREARRVFLSG